MDNIFVKIEYDEKVGFFIEDKVFFKLVENGFKKEDDGYWLVLFLFC